MDDEESLVRLATQTLTNLGYVPVGFTSSAAALEAFTADPQRFDAVITDESMPGISGSNLIRKMRELRPAIPIVLVSGYLDPAIVQQAREAGADEVMKKPLSARELATSLDRVLRATSRRPQSRGVVPSADRVTKGSGRTAASPSRARSRQQR